MGLSFESEPRTFSSHMPPLKTFNTWSFSLGVPHDMLFHSHHLTYRMMSVIVLQFLTFLLLLLKSVSQFLRPYRRLGSHNDPQDKLYQQPPASLLGNNRRKIKQVKPMWGWFHTPWGGEIPKKNARTLTSPWLTHSPESLSVSLLLWYKTKTFPLLLLFTFFTFTSLRYKAFKN